MQRLSAPPARHTIFTLPLAFAASLFSGTVLGGIPAFAVVPPTAKPPMTSVAPSPASPGPTTTITIPWMRAHEGLNQMRLDPKGRFIAYVDEQGMKLSVLDVKTKDIYAVTPHQVGRSFFWSPDGFRLFYREMIRTNNGQTQSPVKSIVKAYDCVLHKSVQLDELPVRTGILTFDPRDLRMHLLSPFGIRTKRIYFPDERLARWQVAQRTENGKWLATQNGLLWVTQGGHSMRRMDDDGSKLESFSLSPDASWAAWATANGYVFASQNGKKPVKIGPGRDPTWHPNELKLLYAGARMVGDKAVSFDLRLSDLRGPGKFLTATQHSNERWPQWRPLSSKQKANSPSDQIIYTVDRTTDVYLLDFQL